MSLQLRTCSLKTTSLIIPVPLILRIAINGSIGCIFLYILLGNSFNMAETQFEYRCYGGYMGQELISFESISVSYSGKKVLENFNLSVSEGEKILLKGKSGSGKSTIFSYLMGYSRPNSGNVLFKGKLLNPANVGIVRESISYVPQNSDVADGNVRDFIHDIFSYAAVSVFPDEKSISDVFSEFGLEISVLDNDFSDLSGGEKQRLLLAISIMLNRDIFLLDEPTSSLDSDLKEKVADYYTRDPSATVLVISHDPQWEKIVDRVVEVGNGV